MNEFWTVPVNDFMSTIYDTCIYRVENHLRNVDIHTMIWDLLGGTDGALCDIIDPDN